MKNTQFYIGEKKRKDRKYYRKNTIEIYYRKKIQLHNLKHKFNYKNIAKTYFDRKRHPNVIIF